MIICLTGMHRSGTSLMSSYLNKCGINMGEKMVGAMHGNLRGHFEDTDFVELHDAILAENHCHMYSPHRSMIITPAQARKADEIIIKRQNQFEHFGWKDPRTTLFLDFWADLLPDCKFVLLYREPYSVIDSLRRRRSDRRVLVMPWLPANAWLKYNQAILDFQKKFTNRCMVVSISGFNSTHEQSRDLLSGFLDYDLNIPYTEVYHKNEIASAPRQSGNPFYRVFDNAYHSRLMSIYDQLESIAQINSKGPC